MKVLPPTWRPDI